MRYLLLVSVLALQTVATVKTPKPVTVASVTTYEISGLYWGAPRGFVTPPPPGLPIDQMPPAPWSGGGSAVWLLSILYVDNLGRYAVDSHAGVYHKDQNTNGADLLVPTLLAAPNQQQWALQHLIDEGRIPPSVVTTTK